MLSLSAGTYSFSAIFNTVSLICFSVCVWSKQRAAAKTKGIYHLQAMLVKHEQKLTMGWMHGWKSREQNRAVKP